MIVPFFLLPFPAKSGIVICTLLDFVLGWCHMILYYTYKQKTKIFAQSFGDVLKLDLYELTSPLNQKSAFLFMFHALRLAITKKAYPIDNMPTQLPGEIYVCAPIWGGRVAAPAKFFLENANLQNIKVNLVLTASVPTTQYKKAAEALLRTIQCTPGEVYLFATSDKFHPDREVLAEQLHEILELN